MAGCVVTQEVGPAGSQQAFFPKRLRHTLGQHVVKVRRWVHAIRIGMAANIARLKADCMARQRAVQWVPGRGQAEERIGHMGQPTGGRVGRGILGQGAGVTAR